MTTTGLNGTGTAFIPLCEWCKKPSGFLTVEGVDICKACMAASPETRRATINATRGDR